MTRLEDDEEVVRAASARHERAHVKARQVEAQANAEYGARVGIVGDFDAQLAALERRNGDSPTPELERVKRDIVGEREDAVKASEAVLEKWRAAFQEAAEALKATEDDLRTAKAELAVTRRIMGIGEPTELPTVR